MNPMTFNAIVLLTAYTVGVGILLVALWYLLPPRARCWLTRHDWQWNHPRTVQKIRIEDCKRCFAWRHAQPVRGRSTMKLDQLDLDGTRRETPVVRLTAEEMESYREAAKSLQREASEAWEAIGGRPRSMV